MTGTVFKGEATFIKALPLMASALIALIIGGLAGIGFIMLQAGYKPPAIFSLLAPLYGSHWYLMILGFTLALISAELLTLLSMEWARRVAPPVIIAVFLVFYWSGIILYSTGYTMQALGASIIVLAISTLYTAKTLLSRSWIGLPPTHYNYLLTLTPPLTGVIIAYWIISEKMGLPSYDLPIATLFLPVAAIIAVESRDIPLLLGIPPTKSLALRSKQLRVRAVMAYIASGIGVILVAMGHLIPGGLLLIVGGLLAASSVALLQAVESASKAIPRVIRVHVATHTTISYIWFIGAGAIAIASGAGYVNNVRVDDAITHMLTLGFMFNVIMGIDAILLYGHAGISLSETPKPQPWPGALLNVGLILRILYDIGIMQGWAAVASGLLTGIAIVGFYARNMRNIRKILKSKSRK
ncbi:MAG: hypothetical protein GSR85_06650 [Desulfurococcales archaeon]|nr:hypothetical protein [Desulfurococcales archaeon]